MILVLSKDKYIKNWKSILLHTCSQNIDPEYKKKKLNHMSLLSKIILIAINLALNVFVYAVFKIKL